MSRVPIEIAWCVCEPVIQDAVIVPDASTTVRNGHARCPRHTRVRLCECNNAQDLHSFGRASTIADGERHGEYAWGSATKVELRIKRTSLIEVLRRRFALAELGERGTQ